MENEEQSAAIQANYESTHTLGSRLCCLWYNGKCVPLPSTADCMRILVGTTFGMGVVTYLAFQHGVPILVASLGASACLIFAVPDAPFAQPRNVICGQTLSAAVGVVWLLLLGCTWYSAALGVGTAVAAMLLSRTMHPPAAATALIAVHTQQTILFPLVPVAAGACILVGAGLLYRQITARIQR